MPHNSKSYPEFPQNNIVNLVVPKDIQNKFSVHNSKIGKVKMLDTSTKSTIYHFSGRNSSFYTIIYLRSLKKKVIIGIMIYLNVFHRTRLSC